MKFHSFALAALALLLPLTLNAENSVASGVHHFVGAPEFLQQQEPIAPFRLAVVLPRRDRLPEVSAPVKTAPEAVVPFEEERDKSKSLEELKALAIRISMQYLPRLKPYARDYHRLVSAVQRYWRENTSNPNAYRLTEVIIRHVKLQHRFMARPRILAGSKKGIALLKREMHKL